MGTYSWKKIFQGWGKKVKKIRNIYNVKMMYLLIKEVVGS
jgi:hypothetical protein